MWKDFDVKGLATTLALIWRLAVPYFRSEDRWAGLTLLAAVIVMELAAVGVTVLINQWNNAFYNALQERNWDAFVYQLGYFCVLAAAYIVIRVYQLYLNQWLQIRWRRWLTARYLGRWLDTANHYRMQLLGDAADNPDQRIAEDTRLFVELSLRIGIGLLGAFVTLLSFVAILWGLSAEAPFTLLGVTWSIPGYLVWAALIYSVVGTAFTHLIGRALIRLNFNQQRYEADFRFNLVRVRENSEQIALLEGENAERERLMDRFANVVNNWRAIMTRQKKLTFFTASFGQVAIIFPYIVVAPAYFSGTMQLGGMMQTASAFGSVQQSLSFFVDSYRELAEWRAVIERLSGFERAIATGHAATQAPSIALAPQPDAAGVGIGDLEVRLPAGSPLVAAREVRFAPGDRVLVNGPSGSGKSTLFRAIAGIWPFGSGAIEVPSDASLMMLPQRPYFPVGSLLAAVSYPALSDRFPADKVREVLTAVGLPGLAARLDEDAHWNRLLSLGEQQRLALARAILHAPRFLFLDEATASLDEASEAALYRLLDDRLADATIVSIGHRSTLHAFHHRTIVLERDGGHFHVHERTMETAAR